MLPWSDRLPSLPNVLPSGVARDWALRRVTDTLSQGTRRGRSLPPIPPLTNDGLRRHLDPKREWGYVVVRLIGPVR